MNAVDAVRNGGGPHFLELKTYRFRAHSMYDPRAVPGQGRSRPVRHRDPIALFTDRCQAEQWVSDGDIEAIEAAGRRRDPRGDAFAEAGTPEPLEDLTRFVYQEERAS